MLALGASALVLWAAVATGYGSRDAGAPQHGGTGALQRRSRCVGQSARQRRPRGVVDSAEHRRSRRAAPPQPHQPHRSALVELLQGESTRWIKCIGGMPDQTACRHSFEAPDGPPPFFDIHRGRLGERCQRSLGVGLGNVGPPRANGVERCPYSDVRNRALGPTTHLRHDADAVSRQARIESV